MTLFKRFSDRIVKGFGSLFGGIAGLTGDLLPGIGGILTGAGNLFENTGSSAESWFDSKTGRALTGAQREQNQFDHDEAELAYQRQIDYYNQFQSPEAMMRQYQSAGLNPAVMMAGGNQGLSSAPSVPQATGSSAGSQTASLADIVQLLSFAKLSESQVNKNNSEAAKNNAEAANADARTEGQKITNQWLPTEYQTNIDNVRQNTNLLIEKVKTEPVQRGLAQSGIDVNEADACLKMKQAFLADIDAQYRAKMHESQLRLQDVQARLDEANIRYKNAMTTQSFAEVRKINVEIGNLYAERERIIAETDRIEADAYGKWLDDFVKNETKQDVILGSHFDAEHLQGRYNWDKVNHISGAVKDVAVGVGAVYGATQMGKTNGFSGQSSLNGAGDYFVGKDGNLYRWNNGKPFMSIKSALH